MLILLPLIVAFIAGLLSVGWYRLSCDLIGVRPTWALIIFILSAGAAAAIWPPAPTYHTLPPTAPAWERRYDHGPIRPVDPRR